MGAGKLKQALGKAALAEVPDRFPDMTGWGAAGSCVMLKQPAPTLVTPGGIEIPEQFREQYERAKRHDVGLLVLGVGPLCKSGLKAGDRVVLKADVQMIGFPQADGDVAWCAEEDICGVLPGPRPTEH